MVIKSLTVTAPVKAADAPLKMVRLLMSSDVPVNVPTAPASRFKLNTLMPSVMVFPKNILPVPEVSAVLAPKVIASL